MTNVGLPIHPATCSALLTDGGFIIVGALLSCLLGFWFANLLRKKDGIARLMTEINSIMTIPRDSNFQARSADMIRNALWKHSHIIDSKSRAKCFEILSEYEKIDKYELAEVKPVSQAWSDANGGKTVEARVSDYLDRFRTTIGA